MSKLTDALRTALLRFLRLDGVNALATLPEREAVQRIGDQLLQVHRIFGDAARVQMGRDVILNDALINTSSGRVLLHDHAFCGHGVSLLTGTHDYTRTHYHRQAGVPQQGRDIIIGEGVWLGSNVTVLGPCTIGAHAVIAAGAVVTGEVEAAAIYAGVPARRIKGIDLQGNGDTAP